MITAHLISLVVEAYRLDVSLNYIGLIALIVLCVLASVTIVIIACRKHRASNSLLYINIIIIIVSNTYYNKIIRHITLQ